MMEYRRCNRETENYPITIFKMIETHHTIPITLWGPNIQENTMRLPSYEHGLIHEEQDVPGNVVRAYRKKVNDTLIPDEKSLMFKLILWKEYFRNIGNIRYDNQIHQLCSLARYRQLEEIRGSGIVHGITIIRWNSKNQAEIILEGIIAAQLQRIKDHTR